MRISSPLAACAALIAVATWVSGCAAGRAIALTAPRAMPSSPITPLGFDAVGEGDGVQVYRRLRDHGLEFAADGHFAASPQRVRDALLDERASKSLDDRRIDYKVVARGTDWNDIYERLSIPLMDDRDYTLHTTWGHDADVLWTQFAVTTEDGPGPIDGVVRVHTYQGGWRLEPESGGATHAFYRSYIDFGSVVIDVLGDTQAQARVVHLFLRVREQLAIPAQR